jgi:hypothetical protein
MARDWYIDYLIQRGACVEYWDIVALVREDHDEREALKPPYLRIFQSTDELRRAVRSPDNRSAIYVTLLTYNGRFASIFELLSGERCRMVNFAWGTLPRERGLNWGRVSAWAANPARYAREIVSRARAKALRSMQRVAPFAVTFAAGSVAITASDHAEKIVPINYFDYDLYMKAKASSANRLISGRYIVFLDSNLPFHSDFALTGSPRIGPAPYYRSLNRFFDRLERAHGCEVVIAAHPRASYNAETFAGRPMFRLVTAELVRDAEFVIAHGSTAIAYAVLNAKPLLFICTNEMACTYRRSLMRDVRCFARYLGTAVRNVDVSGETAVETVPQVDTIRYQRYKYAFLTSPGTENTPTHEIFWRELSAQ